MILAAGGLLGFIAVAFGAWAEHGLRGDLTDEAFHAVMTALRYNLLHAALIAAIGVVLLRPGVRHGAALVRAGWCLIAGTVLFSFSIYLSAVSGVTVVTRVAPVGGLLLMAGWLGLAWTGMRSVMKGNTKRGQPE